MGEMFSQDDDSFWETMGQEPEAAPDEGTPAEPETAAVAEEAVEAVEEDAPERPRDENGRFAKAEPDVDPSVLREELETLRKRVADKDDFIGRQTNEIGELRKAMEDRIAAVEASARRPQVQVTADLIEQNPGYAAEAAFQANDEATLRMAFDAWKDDDPAAAAAWVAAKQIERVQQDYERKFQELEARIGPLAVSDHDRQFNAQLREFEQQHGPISDLASRAEQLDLPAETTATFAHILDSGTPEQKIGVFKTLALLVGTHEDRRTADTLQAARSTIARETADEAERAIQDATVVSATASKVDTPHKKLADLIGDEWDALEAPHRDGWNLS